jgi:hypothetical protein
MKSCRRFLGLLLGAAVSAAAAFVPGAAAHAATSDTITVTAITASTDPIGTSTTFGLTINRR